MTANAVSGGFLSFGLMADRAYALADAPEAHRRVEEGRALGKVVVTIAEFRSSGA